MRERSFADSLLAMTGIGMVNLLIALDQTTVSTAMPSIAAAFDGFAYYAWVAGAYLLTSVIAVPIFGRLGDYHGRKPYVVAAIVTFTTASLLCAWAPTMPALIAARALQGVGAGMMTGTAFASIPDLFPDPAARVRWQVVLAAAYGVGTAAGPSLGGWLTDAWGWRSTFLINLPIGIAALGVVVRHLPSIKPAPRGPVQLDVSGALLLSLLLAALLVALGGVDAARLPHARLLATCALPVLVCVFYRREQRAISPIVPPAMLRNPRLATLFCLSSLTGALMFALIFYVPLVLQAGLGFSAALAGQLATPLAASIAVGSLLNTGIVTRLERPVSVIVAGFLLLALANVGVSLAAVRGERILMEAAMMGGGIGLGFILNNLNIFAQEAAGRAYLGIATSLMQSTRQIGGLVAVSAIGAWTARRYPDGGHDILGASVPDALRQSFVFALHYAFDAMAAIAVGAAVVALTIRQIRLSPAMPTERVRSSL
jgi:MFS family permease